MAKAITLLALALALPAIAAGAEAAGKTVTFDVASGGVLGSLVTALVAYLYSLRRQRTQVSPDPLNVRGVPPSVKEPVCAAVHKGVDGRLDKNDEEHGNIFPRMSSLETRLSTLEGTIGEIRAEYKSIDDKLTALLRRR